MSMRYLSSAAPPTARSPGSCTSRSAAGGNRSACGGGLSPLQRERAPVTLRLAGGLVLALGSALALNWSYFVQHGAAASLPPLTLRRPLHSLAALFGNRRWLIGFW